MLSNLMYPNLYTNFNVTPINANIQMPDCRYLLDSLEYHFNASTCQKNGVNDLQHIDESVKEFDINCQTITESLPNDQQFPNSVGDDFNSLECHKIDRQVHQIQTRRTNGDYGSINCQKTATQVAQLHETDTELLNLLSSEQECNAIFENIVMNDQIHNLIGQEPTVIHSTQTNYSFIDNTNLESYATRHSEEDVHNSDDLKCNYCGKVLSSRKILKKHINRHNQAPNYSCEICGKRFKYSYEVTAHKRSHETPSLQCEICSKMFIHKSHLNAHHKNHQNGSTKCSICNLTFSSQAEYVKHKNNDHFPSVCDTCGLKLSSSSALKEHKQIHEINHGQEKDHVCNVCGKNYISKRSLKAHIATHSNSKRYVCKICGKSVSSKVILETHIKMHTGIKDFICKVCDKRFSSKEYLTVHQRIHDGTKPYQCSVCQKRFSQKTSLTVHSRFHSGQRPYKCECGKNFATKSHLMKHYKTHELGNVHISYPLHTSLQSL